MNESCESHRGRLRRRRSAGVDVRGRCHIDFRFAPRSGSSAGYRDHADHTVTYRVQESYFYRQV